jgi:L-malate glycosyltransferase
MITVLFIGNFLSKTTGTCGVSENVAKLLEGEDIKCILVSSKQNQFFRLFDILWKQCVLQYDIVHIDVFSGKAFLIAQLSSWLQKLKGNDIIMTLHGGRLPEFTDTKSKIVLNVLRRAKVLQTPSLYLISWFKSRGLEINYLPNGIDTYNFPKRAEQITKDYNPRLLWVRAFSSIYNPAVAILTLAYVKHYFPKTTLTMIGPDKGILSDVVLLTKQLNLTESVVLTGPIPNNELYKYYHAHDVFLNTTSYESFGVAVIEAAHCGIPIVSSSVGEIPFLWTHDKNILLVKNISGEGFGEQVVRLLRIPEFARSISGQAYIRAQDFTWVKIKKTWIELLKDSN